jgi:hypothetical protein
MMPFCDIEGCEEVAQKMFETDKEYQAVWLCEKHNPESNRATRRKKKPSDPRHTKKLFKRKKS